MMNKIIISDDEIQFIKQDGLIEMIKEKSSNILQVKLIVKGNTSLKIYQKTIKKSNIDITIELFSHTFLDILDFKQGKNIITKYQYYLQESSILNVQKFYDCNQVNEEDKVHLNGKKAELSYRLTTISKQEQTFKFIVYHNASHTKSNVIHHGVNVDNGQLSFDLTGIVYQHMIDCILDQNSRIITLNEKECNINPNLFMEENDVIASHSAFIGKFSDEELFYLQSRAVPYKKALHLLIKGFLLQNIQEDEIINTINQYWR